MVLLAHLLIFVLPFFTLTSAYSVKTPPLTTNWTYQVGTDPWPEYPRPQQVRDRWQSLNGVWSYRNASGLNALKGQVPTGYLGTDVLIPSCLESGLSGVMAPVTANGSVLYSWFRTTFDVPSDWEGDNVVINFGAVDYEATVFVNGQNVSFHRGGYFRFAADITSALSSNGTNELVVFVHDPTDSEGYVIPIGKQTLKPSHIFYTPCTGIWQQVFIEPVPAEGYIQSMQLDGDMNGQVNITVFAANQSSGDVKVQVWDNGQEIGMGDGQANQPIVFNASNVQQWSPESPTLYNMTVTMGNDTVQTYTGFRTLSKGTVNNVTRPMLNGEFYFIFGTLDQGFWPDGIYTPPTYDAMVYDLQILKMLGFNMLRKHIKVEMDLFYQACDQMGLLVIQDMPALLPSNNPLPNATQQDEFDSQLWQLVDTHRSFPSIMTWIIYNEGWGQLPTAPELELTPQLRSMDPTRLIDSVTGWNDHGAGDFSDNHHYSDPQCGTPWYSTASSPYDPTRIGFQGEFGGIGLNSSLENLWDVQEAILTINQTYELDANEAAWNFRGHFLLNELLIQTQMYSCSGAIWTQTTDVEGEQNGLLSYDRRVLRTYVSQWQNDIQALYDAAGARGGSQGKGGSGGNNGTMTGENGGNSGNGGNSTSSGGNGGDNSTCPSGGNENGTMPMGNGTMMNSTSDWACD